MTTCPDCGSEFGAEAPSGLCPHCLAREGLALLAEAGTAPASAAPAASPASPVKEEPAGRFGDYELLGEIAHGGMGVVYHARQISLNRAVALKMIRSGHLATAAEVQRFRNEATAAARLDHPHIVPIYDVGEHHGRHYFTMKLVEGGSLAEAIAGRPLEPRRAARLLALVAHAVHFAHQRGILHRDLKPTNILLDSQGEPQLTDFGLAKVVGSESGVTRSAEVLGSASYMSPEQASGQVRQLSTATDIYSLGAILYEMLTAQPPHRAETFVATLRQVVDVEPLPPRRLLPALDRDLETICLKCLEKRPGGRYSSAEALAQDLERWLAGETILARPGTHWERAVKWGRRKPAVAALLASVLLTAACGLAGVLWQWHKAEFRARELRRHLYAADIKLAQRALEEHNLGRAVALLRKYLPDRAAEEDLRGFEWQYLWAQTRSQDLASFKHDGFVESVAFSPDGKLLASLARDRTVRVWDAGTYQSIANLAALDAEPSRGSTVTFSPNGQFLLAGIPAANRSLAVWVWTTADWRLATHLSAVKPPVFFSLDDKRLYARQTTSALAWDTATWQSQATTNFDGLGRLMVASADARTLFTSTDTGGAKVWSIGQAKAIATYKMTQSDDMERECAAAVSSDGRHLAIAGWTGWVKLFDTASGRCLTNWTAHASSIYGLAFSPDGKWLASGGFDQMIHLWAVPTSAKIGSLRGHLSEVWAIAFSPDGQFLASCGKDCAVRLWSTQSVPEDDTLPGALKPLGFRARGDQFVAAKTNGDLGVWEVRTGRPLESLLRQAAPPRGATAGALSKDAHLGALGTETGQVLLWRDQPGTAPQVFSAHEGAVLWLEFTSDNRLLASASTGSTRLWEVATGRLLLRLDGGQRCAAFSPDGRKLLTGGPGYTGIIWEVTSGRKLATLRPHQWTLYAGAFSPDSRRVVTTALDGLARVWDAADGRLLAVLEGHLEGVITAAFTPDGRTLATGSTDDTVKLWNMQTYQELITLKGFDDDVGSVMFSPDGQALAVGCFVASGASRPVHLLRVPSLAEIDARERKPSLGR